MAAPDISLQIDLDIPELPMDAGQVFPHLEAAVELVAYKVQERWREYAQGKPLPNGKAIGVRSGGYLKSIQIEQKNPLTWEVYSDAPYASAIEYGQAPYDMKQALATSPKVRRTKDGKRYLIIPFRWGTPGAVTFGAKNTMTQAEHKFLKILQPSHVTGMGQRESGNYPGMMIAQRQYKWGGRLRDPGNPTFQSKQGRRMQGMVRFDNPSGGHSSYLTFRVMTEDSTGWIRPAQPGKYPLKETMLSIELKASEIFQKALQKDVDNLLAGVS